MGSCRESKQMELYKILKKTKYDYRNKALMTYYSSGMTPKLNEIFKAILRANIPSQDVKPLALILYNRARNGAGIPGHKRWSSTSWEDKIRDNPSFVCYVHSLTRRSTLERWREAMFLIDMNRAKKKLKT